MLTDEALERLRPRATNYKVADGDGMYVLVRPSGTLTFQLDYRLNGRRETVTLGKHGPGGLSLARARALCADARRMIADGRSPAAEKQLEKRRRRLQAASAGEEASPGGDGGRLARERVAPGPPSLAGLSKETGKRARTRATLLDATARLIAVQDADDISIGDITVAAGVANGTFYNYFKTKAEIIAETAFHITERLGAAIHDPKLAEEDPVAMVAIGARRTMDFAIEHPTWAWALVRSAAYLPHVRTYIYRGIGATVRLGVRRGVFKAKHDDFTLHLLISMSFAAIQERLLGKVGPDVGARLGEMHLRALGVAPDEAAAAAWSRPAARTSSGRPQPEGPARRRPASAGHVARAKPGA